MTGPGPTIALSRRSRKSFQRPTRLNHLSCYIITINVRANGDSCDADESQTRRSRWPLHWISRTGWFRSEWRPPPASSEMARSSTPDPGTKRRAFGIVVLVVSTYLVMAANGGMFLLVVSLKQMAGDLGWPRSVPSLAYALFFAGTGLGGIAMGWWFDRSGTGPVTLLGLTMIGIGSVLASSIGSPATSSTRPAATRPRSSSARRSTSPTSSSSSASSAVHEPGAAHRSRRRRRHSADPGVPPPPHPPDRAAAIPPGMARAAVRRGRGWCALGCGARSRARRRARGTVSPRR